MARCDLCGKKWIFGKTSTHHRGVAGGQWKKKAQKTQKIFKPNLHYAWVQVEGIKKRLHLCTKCIRQVRQDQKQNSPTVSTPAS